MQAYSIFIKLLILHSSLAYSIINLKESVDVIKGKLYEQEEKFNMASQGFDSFLKTFAAMREESRLANGQILDVLRSLTQKEDTLHLSLERLLESTVASQFELQKKNSKDQNQQLAEKIQDLKSHLTDVGLKIDQIGKNVSTHQKNELKNEYQDVEIKRLQSVVCSITASARKMIENDLIKLSTGTYYASNHSMSWYTARDLCSQLGMDLAKFNSKREMELVYPKVKVDDGGIWVAASDIGRPAGQFRWTDGSEVDTDLWYESDPDHFVTGKDTCVHMYRNGALLGDWTCAGSSVALCQNTACV